MQSFDRYVPTTLRHSAFKAERPVLICPLDCSILHMSSANLSPGLQHTAHIVLQIVHPTPDNVKI